MGNKGANLMFWFGNWAIALNNPTNSLNFANDYQLKNGKNSDRFGCSLDFGRFSFPIPR
jgi:hypothetical protein